MTIRNRNELIEYVNHGHKVKYVFFWGHQERGGISKSCFSQWYDSPFESGGLRFQTAEHFIMHGKAVLFGDEKSATKSLLAANPGEAKSVGRAVRGFDQQQWEANRFDVVVAANVAKFSCHPKLREFLLRTGDRILVEASPVDKVWGIGLAEDSPHCENPNQWRGDNLLGFALMEVRDLLS